MKCIASPTRPFSGLCCALGERYPWVSDTPSCERIGSTLSCRKRLAIGI